MNFLKSDHTFESHRAVYSRTLTVYTVQNTLTLILQFVRQFLVCL